MILHKKTPNSITIQFQRLTVHRSLGEVVEVQYFTRYVPHDRLQIMAQMTNTVKPAPYIVVETN